ncbi:hypothetical protein AbraIFM66951_004538 [Aspergillus brasiliensis]|uniref:Xylanolytic transcriptional activator regulatory domain-containing protein n=1 Tax=Aspergillus brasiliensis TaxID=319629 RepID=A0A9W5Z3S0_9EURO|nr:hypothetical protein AbraCBS73388_003710 [Aspergillus brasiliensis]GKZ50846.1 hypothetical protein AbraIFM66951_004538 [Aspergillus brasiliensis]
MTDFLPTTFFDTNYSLSDIWQTGDMRVNSSVASLPVAYGNNESPPRDLQGPSTFTSLSSRLPPLEPDSLSSRNERLPYNELESATGFDPSEVSRASFPWDISVRTHERLSVAIRSYERILPAEFLIPSRHTMSRYIEGYFRSFHEHFPFLHPPTIKMDTLIPELVLAMAGIGAFFRVEKRKGYALYLASKAIVTHYLEQRTRMPIVGLAGGSSNRLKGGVHAVNPINIERGVENDGSLFTSDACLSSHPLQTLQTLIILMAMATSADVPAVRDALVMGSQLAMLTREAGLSQPDEIVGQCSWVDWIHREEYRRTLFTSYILSNLTSITFNVPPLLVNNEIGLSLPHCNTEWVKLSAAEWQYTRETCGHTERQFQSTLEETLAGRDIHHEEPLSALGNYALINAIIQNIYFKRQTTVGHSFNPDTIKKFESALQVWQRSWEATQETSLDPSSPSGPLGFNSAALLRLAYLRLNANIAPCRNLISQDPKSIAQSIACDISTLFTRSLHVDRAVLQCIHALSIPIRVGIPFVAYTQSINESIQHPLCSLECAILLSRWLGIISEAVQATGLETLREDERKLLGMIASLIKETDMASTLDSNDADSYCIRRMAATVVRLWAETFRGIHIFEIVRVIGETLSALADILEENLGQ